MEPTTNRDDDLLTPEECACEHPLRPSAGTIKRWARDGIQAGGRVIRLRAIRLPRRLLIRRYALREFQEAIDKAKAGEVPVTR